MKNTLFIDFSVRLPDINKHEQLATEFDDYGRFAIRHNDMLWFGTLQSSHPQDTQEGFYWALNYKIDTLFISPRGATLNWRKYITSEIISWLLEKLHLNKRYKYIKEKNCVGHQLFFPFNDNV